jgi:hypothetical protein
MARSVIASGGPLLIGVVTAVTASQKAGMAVLVLFFVAGLALLARVREEQGSSAFALQSRGMSFRDAADGEADWRRPGIQRCSIISGFRVRSQLTLRAPRNDSLSVLEVPDAGEHHGNARVVGGLDHFVVAHRATGLDHRGGAGLDRDQQAVRKREERIRRHD